MDRKLEEPTLTPSAIRPCARTIDVVVPSPAKSLFLAAETNRL